MKKLVLLILSALFLFAYSCGDDGLTKKEFKSELNKFCDYGLEEDKAECLENTNKVDKCKDYDGVEAEKLIDKAKDALKCIKDAQEDISKLELCRPKINKMQKIAKKVCSNYDEIFETDN